MCYLIIAARQILYLFIVPGTNDNYVLDLGSRSSVYRKRRNRYNVFSRSYVHKLGLGEGRLPTSPKVRAPAPSELTLLPPTIFPRFERLPSPPLNRLAGFETSWIT